MRVLVACEFSGRVRDAFRRLGHDAVSCDMEPSDTKGPHIQGDVLDELGQGWDMLIGFPPCTHLASSGARWFAQKRADGRQQAGLAFFMQLAGAPIPSIALENPVGILSTQWRKPDQIIQPWQYGHPETKSTCLWLKNLPPLKPTEIVEPDYMRKSDGTFYRDKKGRRMSRIHYMSWSKDPKTRGRLRSITYSGIADAMAEQWGQA